MPSIPDAGTAGPDEGLETGLVTRSRVSPRLLWGLTALGVAGAFAWYATHPEPLPGAGNEVTATTRAGVPVYVGVLPPADRTLALREVAVDAEAGVAVVRVCRGGSFGVTSDPAAFCSSLVDAAGATLAPGDSLVLEVAGEAAGTVEVSEVVVSWREGLRWGRQAVGPDIAVTVVE